ncbi:unnamed protein product [Heligmosomoides polygyrus]|uniref:Decapping nuclease n=1 Tax=Heligmosomoides polygyrus TaxID=6339 RepID=A0A3P8E2Q2_HELPZ|nr:unnamed protein product [Heligmosomoides polygyrus]
MHEADFVCWRGLLTRIAATPFCPKDPWEFAAARIGGVIFLCEKETEEAKQRKLSMSQREKMMSYWGFKFEQHMTIEEQGVSGFLQFHMTTLKYVIFRCNQQDEQ